MGNFWLSMELYELTMIIWMLSDLSSPASTLSCFNCATKRHVDCNVGLCEGLGCFIDYSKNGNGKSLKKGCVSDTAAGCFPKEDDASVIRCVCDDEDFCNNRTIKMSYNGNFNTPRRPLASMTALSARKDEHGMPKEFVRSEEIHRYIHVTWKTSLGDFHDNKPNRFHIKLPSQMRPSSFVVGLVDYFVTTREGWAYNCLMVTSNLVGFQLGPTAPGNILRIVDPQRQLPAPIYHRVSLQDGVALLLEIKECSGEPADGISNALLVLDFKRRL